MPQLREGQLDLRRCPHCNVANPFLGKMWGVEETKAYTGSGQRWWAAYRCRTCGGVILAASNANSQGPITELYPESTEVDETVPAPARAYLTQAIESLSAPAGAVMLAASAVDGMLKAKGYKEGSLYKRIDQAAAEHVITNGMAEWAHNVRLDANDPRHADESAPLPSADQAKKSVDFALALAEFLFVLPARVDRGRAAAAAGKVG